jgi:protein-arginine kinase activator protein McsA
VPAKKPAAVLADDRSAQMMSLRKELDAAVKGERYEHAAKLRDQLRKLEEGAR